MYRIIFKLCIVFSIVSPSLPFQNNYRRYNVDHESVKLYGEEFKSVMKRFRRTPDYLKILQDKLGDLKTSAREMSMQVLHYYHGKLEDRVNEVIPTTTTADTPPNIKREKYKKPGHAHSNRRQGDGEATTEAVDESLQKIHNLDNYKVFESKLSVTEQNSLKDLGFEFAGKIIHSIIDNMGPKPEQGIKEQKYTHVPDDLSHENKADPTTTTTTTTTHPPEHAVTHESPKEDDAKTVPADAKTVPDDAKTVADDAKTVPDDANIVADDAKTEPDERGPSTQGIIHEIDATRSRNKSKILSLEF